MIPVECPYVEFGDLRQVTTGAVVLIAGKNDEPPGVVLLTLTDYSKPSYQTLKSTSNQATRSFPRGIVSLPQAIALKIPPNDEPLYLNYYPPTNPDYTGPQGERPPCIVNAHGGPTARASQVLNWTIQFFTSRGWAW
jgi:dipeptidyl aminopeptidase/acylaminoacyl peptidase